MKTNHQRGFVEKVTAYIGPHRDGSRYRDDGDMMCMCIGADGEIISQHRGSRGFKHFGGKAPLANKTFGASANIHDSVKGKHGVAKNIKGAKKYIRTRVRFHENVATRRLKEEVIQAGVAEW